MQTTGTTPPTAAATNDTSTPLVQPGVWVEALDVIPAGTTTGQRTERRWGSYAAPDAASAIRWMRVSVRTVTPILGPLQSSYVLDNWVRGPQSLADYHRLCRGRDCSLTVCRDGIETVWRARPTRFLHIVAVNGGPSCAPEYRTLAERKENLLRAIFASQDGQVEAS